MSKSRGRGSYYHAESGSLPHCLEKWERGGYSYVKPTVIRPPLKASLCFTTT